ncbi:MAG: CGGC domain-containing protein [Desulfovibrionaceae bacterium]|jgi:predicted metal-binding protein|nr:CGGC domain-containing protein [Desulfovibrionaceae bacterium]
MEKILVMGCQRTMNSICVACSRCLVAFNRREGAFARYKDKEAEIIGFLGCGDCPGQGVVVRMAQLAQWNAKLGEKPTVIHLGPCLTGHCPYADELVTKIKAKAGCEVVEGAHPYLPENVFA